MKKEIEKNNGRTMISTPHNTIHIQSPNLSKLYLRGNYRKGLI